MPPPRGSVGAVPGWSSDSRPAGTCTQDQEEAPDWGEEEAVTFDPYIEQAEAPEKETSSEEQKKDTSAADTSSAAPAVPRPAKAAKLQTAPEPSGGCPNAYKSGKST